MKSIYLPALMGVMGTILVASPFLPAARVESSAAKLKDDAVKTESKNGAVTLTETVTEAPHKSLAQDTVEGVRRVKTVVNNKTNAAAVSTSHSPISPPQNLRIVSQ